MKTIPVNLEGTKNNPVEGERNTNVVKLTLSEELRGYSTYIVRRTDGYGETSDSERLYERNGEITMPLTEDILRGKSLKLQVIAFSDDFERISKSEIVEIPVDPSLYLTGKGTKQQDLLIEMVRVLDRAEKITANAEQVKELRKTVDEIKITDAGKAADKVALVSFIDDDCRRETYTELFPIIKELGIPYSLACPPGQIGSSAYVTPAELKEMYKSGVSILSHSYNENAVTSFGSAAELEADIQKTISAMEKLEIRDVKAYAYPNGLYNEDYINTIKKYFKLGFTVERGTNEIPYESYFMKRCELFPTNGQYTLADAKALVDNVAKNGGWLVFMTHAWYITFNANELKELIAYIKSKGVEIVGVNNALNATGNIIDIGVFKKPIEAAIKPFFVLDSFGRTWSNSANIVKPGEGEENIPLVLQEGKLLAAGTGKLTLTADKAYKVSQKVLLNGADYLLITGWASDGNGLYCFYNDADVRLHTEFSTVTWTNGGTTLKREKVLIPAGATKVAVAGYFYKTMPALTVVKTADSLESRVAELERRTEVLKEIPVPASDGSFMLGVPPSWTDAKQKLGFYSQIDLGDRAMRDWLVDLIKQQITEYHAANS